VLPLALCLRRHVLLRVLARLAYDEGYWAYAMLTVALLTAAALSAPPAAAASYCPDPAHAKPAKIPPDLVPAVAKAFALDPGTLGAAFVRCSGDKLLGCMVGANLVCDKADQRRALPGATAWCRENPGANVIPMAATGHATVYEWSCKGARLGHPRTSAASFRRRRDFH
jgi:hypothetical protein